MSDTILGRRLKDALVQFSHLDVVSGHFLLQHGDSLPQDRCCMTVLRNPIDRFLSEYFYHKSDGAERLLDSRRHVLSLDTYLEQLSLNEQEAMAIQIGMLYSLGTSSRTILSLEEKFTAAIKAIDSFELIGVQEELEDFACMLDARFGWEHVPLKLKNVTSQRIKTESLSPQHTQKLRAFFAHELELYEYAKSRFQASRREFIKRSIAGGLDKNTEIVASSPMPCEESICDQHTTEFGDKRCSIEEVCITGENSGASMVMIGEYFDISLKIKAANAIDTLNVSIAIKDERGLLIFSTNSMLLGHIYSLSRGEYVVHFKIFNRMPRGSYYIDTTLMAGENQYIGCFHSCENIASFTVYDSAVMHFEGHIFMDADVSLASTGDSIYEHKPYVAAAHQVRSFGRNNKKLHQFKSSVLPAARIENFFPGMDMCIPMRLENTGDETWAAYGRQPVALTYRWLAKDGEIVVADGLRTRLPADVLPGMAVIVPMQINVPAEPQSLQLMVSLVQEAVAWFVDRNPDAAYIMPVELV
ncbi:Wzt carbohydrate-binding domain-containing protein [Dyella sp. M7H15-1]|uniref:Wzt carbohydrate-binding domain-containing protein n=1 Tax=Dyella sp. M7H15-1 TaxID=2501295 RepID=UPI0031B73912